MEVKAGSAVLRMTLVITEKDGTSKTVDLIGTPTDEGVENGSDSPDRDEKLDCGHSL